MLYVAGHLGNASHFSLALRMKLALVCSVLCLCSITTKAGPIDSEHTLVTYNQQQHATGHNVRVNLNKILIAILPLEEALAGLSGLGGGPSYEDFAELTLADLKPPPAPTAEEPEEEEEINDSAANATTATVTNEVTDTASSTVAPTAATKLLSTVQAVGIARKPLRNSKPVRNVPCTQADFVAGRCTPHKRPTVGLARLLLPLLRQFQESSASD
ncbi:hypothetical protein B566_EDAN012116 [Ephemera danica]|nr:hypothetical protein B566_EDAN012116 [Ephemera danica]